LVVAEGEAPIQALVQLQAVLVAAQLQAVAMPPVEYLTQQAVQLDHR
jgi:hypothetical protein